MSEKRDNAIIGWWSCSDTVSTDAIIIITIYYYAVYSGTDFIHQIHVSFAQSLIITYKHYSTVATSADVVS